MSMMAPIFREINRSRIEELAKTLSDATIAHIIHDETGLRIEPHDVKSYLKMSCAASSQMLVSRKTMMAVTAAEQDDPEAAEA